MVELQIVILAVAGSSPVGHPNVTLVWGDGFRGSSPGAKTVAQGLLNSLS